MCIGSNSVNQAQDLISVTKFEDFPNSLLPNIQAVIMKTQSKYFEGLDATLYCCHCLRIKCKIIT